jgi:hypothetical protein
MRDKGAVVGRITRLVAEEHFQRRERADHPKPCLHRHDPDGNQMHRTKPPSHGKHATRNTSPTRIGTTPGVHLPSTCFRASCWELNRLPPVGSKPGSVHKSEHFHLPKGGSRRHVARSPCLGKQIILSNVAFPARRNDCQARSTRIGILQGRQHQRQARRIKSHQVASGRAGS